jgi:hypothetical protein
LPAELDKKAIDAKKVSREALKDKPVFLEFSQGQEK